MNLISGGLVPPYKALEKYSIDNVYSRAEGKMKPRLISPEGKALIPVEEVFYEIERYKIINEWNVFKLKYLRAHLENGHQKAFSTLWKGIKDHFPKGNISESMVKYFVEICEVCNQNKNERAIPAAEPTPPTPQIPAKTTSTNSQQVYLFSKDFSLKLNF